MLFAHDTEQVLAEIVALVNSAHPQGEPIDDPAQLASHLDRWRYSGSRAGDAAELAAVHRLRRRLRGLWCGDVDAVVRLVNALLVEGRALPQLVRHDGFDYHLHATPPDAPLHLRIGVEAAMAVLDVVRGGELERMRECAAPGCGWLMVDLSRNRSRRFCGTTCANRVNVAAYRARRSGDGAGREGDG